MDNKKIKTKLDSIEVPEQLEQRIRQNWHQQLKDDKATTNIREKTMIAVAASIFVVVVLLRTMFSTPALINAALEDIAADAKHAVGISVPLDSILVSNKIQAPLHNMPVRLTKYCNLNGAQTVHMQIAGAKQGNVHLFVKDGEFDNRIWQDAQGITDHMTWKIIHPRDDLSVLVIHTQEMNPLNVDKLVQQMFYS